MKFVALLPIVMLFANAIGLLTQVLIPRFLTPGEYTNFSTIWATGQFVSVFFFEWLRIGILRFSEGSDRKIVDSRRETMIQSLLGITVLLLTITLISLLLHKFLDTPTWVAAIAFYALCQGVFDSLQARRRAAGMHSQFITVWSVRSVLSLVLALGVSTSTRSGSATVLALAISYPISLIADVRRVTGRVRTLECDKASLIFLLKFGTFMAAANAIGLLFPTLVRFQANLYLPSDSAGGVALAFDHLQKVVGLAGLAVNIIVAQQSFRSAEFDDARRQLDQVKMQIFAPGFMVLTGAAAFVVLLHQLRAMFVPPAYAQSFEAVLPYAVMSCTLIAVRMYSLDPLFVMVARTRSAVLGPLITLVITSSLTAILLARGVGKIEAIGMGASFGSLLGLIVSFAVLHQRMAMPPTLAGVLLMLFFVGSGLSIALALPAMPVWVDLPTRLIALGTLASIAPALIFRTEISTRLSRVRLD